MRIHTSLLRSWWAYLFVYFKLCICEWYVFPWWISWWKATLQCICIHYASTVCTTILLASSFENKQIILLDFSRPNTVIIMFCTNHTPYLFLYLPLLVLVFVHVSHLGLVYHLQVCCDVYVGFEDEDSRSYELAASSENEMQRWIQAIRNARCIL